MTYKYCQVDEIRFLLLQATWLQANFMIFVVASLNISRNKNNVKFFPSLFDSSEKIVSWFITCVATHFYLDVFFVAPLWEITQGVNSIKFYAPYGGFERVLNCQLLCLSEKVYNKYFDSVKIFWPCLVIIFFHLKLMNFVSRCKKICCEIGPSMCMQCAWT